MKKERIFVWILIASFVKGIIWAIVVPPLQTPDEPVHFEYVQFMAENNKIPILRDEAQHSSEMELFYKSVDMRNIAYHTENKYKINENLFKELSDNRQNYDRNSNGSSVAAGYPPGYYFFAALFYKFFYFSSIFDRYYAVRLFSVLLGVLATAITYLISSRLFDKKKNIAITISILVSFHPMFSMVGIAVNNDILMNTVTMAIMLSLIYIIYSPTRKRLLFTGVLLGFGLIIKPTMVFVTAIALSLILVYFISKKFSLQFWIESAVYLFVPILIIYLPWGIFSFKHYHSFTGGIGMQPPGDLNVGLHWYIVNTFLIKEAIFRSFDTWVVSFWANFGWLDTRFTSRIIYKVLALISLASVVGSIYGIIKRKKYYKTIAVCLIVVILNFIFLYLVEIQYFMRFHNFMLQGRYLFTSLVPISIIIVMGISYLFPEKLKNYVFYSLCLLMFLFNVSSLDIISSRYY
ncbi:hypothetical protein PPM_4502 [Paenibacillus polymyxa M1]|uniref:DUF2142 domain-containing protein n=1 Tax=Paenibacillus polymyxa TaxID=1406 RepID=UPI0002661266|nr:DUF2142 domain-containing protein [Paenibacillus polymyxa]OAZ50983.1 hypothetical protein A9Z39_01470 [Paenibacillus polymyxa]CCI71309.1 hypothetical protein PPM_4502 [Paenibacillus polymyxa M1]